MQGCRADVPRARLQAAVPQAERTNNPTNPVLLGADGAHEHALRGPELLSVALNLDLA